MKSRRRSRDWMEDFAWWGVFYHGVRKRRHTARRKYVDFVHLKSVSLITFSCFLILIWLLGFRNPFTATRESSWDTRHRTLTPSSNTPSPQFVQGLRQYFPIREKHDWSGSPNFLGSSVSIHPSIASTVGTIALHWKLQDSHFCPVQMVLRYPQIGEPIHSRPPGPADLDKRSWELDTLDIGLGAWLDHDIYNDLGREEDNFEDVSVELFFWGLKGTKWLWSQS